jgi:hypothetical protein
MAPVDWRLPSVGYLTTRAAWGRTGGAGLAGVARIRVDSRAVATYDRRCGGVVAWPRECRVVRSVKVKRYLKIAGWVAGSLLLLVVIGLFALWRASQVVPEFYEQALAADPAAERGACETMLQKSTLLASDVRKTGRWEGLFTIDEINGFLAVDLEENHRSSMPPEISAPRIVLDEGQLKMACRARQGGVSTVLSLSVDLYLAEPNVVGIRLRSVRAGAVPLPMNRVMEQIRAAGDRQGMVVRWQEAEGDPVALVRFRPTVDGGKPVVIDTLELADGEIYVAGETTKPPKRR